MVSDITDRLLPQIEDWQKRPLNEVYSIILMLYIFLYDAAEKLGPSSVKAIRSISVIN